MSPRQLLIVFIMVGLTLGIIVLLLVTGGVPPGVGLDRSDPSGDVTVEGDENPPADTALADIIESDVVADGSGITFTARMAQAIPTTPPKGDLGMQWRWEVIEGGETTWILSANLDHGPIATLVSQRTDYAASTIDSTLPGRIAVEGDKILVHLEPSTFAGFPGSFNWTLVTALDSDRTESESAVARDSAPEVGIGQYPPP